MIAYNKVNYRLEIYTNKEILIQMPAHETALTFLKAFHCAWNGHGRSEKIAGQKFLRFCILMGILKLKKYLKIFSIGTTFYVIKNSVFLVILQKKIFWL